MPRSIQNIIIVDDSLEIAESVTEPSAILLQTPEDAHSYASTNPVDLALIDLHFETESKNYNGLTAMELLSKLPNPPLLAIRAGIWDFSSLIALTAIAGYPIVGWLDRRLKPDESRQCVRDIAAGRVPKYDHRFSLGDPFLNQTRAKELLLNLVPDSRRFDVMRGLALVTEARRMWHLADVRIKTDELSKTAEKITRAMADVQKALRLQQMEAIGTVQADDEAKQIVADPAVPRTNTQWKSAGHSVLAGQRMFTDDYAGGVRTVLEKLWEEQKRSR